MVILRLFWSSDLLESLSQIVANLVAFLRVTSQTHAVAWPAFRRPASQRGYCSLPWLSPIQMHPNARKSLVLISSKF
jgi:hypothetical protein